MDQLSMNELQWQALSELLARIGTVSVTIKNFNKSINIAKHLLLDDRDWHDFDASTAIYILWADLEGKRGTNGLLFLQLPALVTPQQSALAGIQSENRR